MRLSLLDIILVPILLIQFLVNVKVLGITGTSGNFVKDMIVNGVDKYEDVATNPNDDFLNENTLCHQSGKNIEKYLNHFKNSYNGSTPRYNNILKCHVNLVKNICSDKLIINQQTNFFLQIEWSEETQTITDIIYGGNHINMKQISVNKRTTKLFQALLACTNNKFTAMKKAKQITKDILAEKNVFSNNFAFAYFSSDKEAISSELELYYSFATMTNTNAKVVVNWNRLPNSKAVAWLQQKIRNNYNDKISNNVNCLTMEDIVTRSNETTLKSLLLDVFNMGNDGTAFYGRGLSTRIKLYLPTLFPTTEIKNNILKTIILLLDTEEQEISSYGSSNNGYFHNDNYKFIGNAMANVTTPMENVVFNSLFFARIIPKPMQSNFWKKIYNKNTYHFKGTVASKIGMWKEIYEQLIDSLHSHDAFSRLEIFKNRKQIEKAPETGISSASDLNLILKSEYGVRIPNAQLFEKKLNLFVNDIFQTINAASYVNVYMGGAKSKILPLHTSVTSKFIVQVSGTKIWEICMPKIDSRDSSAGITPADLATRLVLLKKREGRQLKNNCDIDKSMIDIYKKFTCHNKVLNPGDVLYVPKGAVHRCTANSENNDISIHYTFAIEDSKFNFKNMYDTTLLLLDHDNTHNNSPINNDTYVTQSNNSYLYYDGSITLNDIKSAIDHIVHTDVIGMYFLRALPIWVATNDYDYEENFKYLNECHQQLVKYISLTLKEGLKQYAHNRYYNAMILLLKLENFQISYEHMFISNYDDVKTYEHRRRLYADSKYHKQ